MTLGTDGGLFETLSEERRNAIDAFLDRLQDADDSVIDFDQQTNLKYSFRESVANQAGVSADTVTRTLKEEHDALLERWSEQGIEFDGDVSPSIINLSNDTNEVVSEGFAGQAQSDARTFGELNESRQAAVDGVVAAMKYLPEKELRAVSGDDVFVRVVDEAVEVSGQPVGIVNAVVSENSNIIENRAGIRNFDEWLDRPDSMIVGEPDNLQLDPDTLSKREREVTGYSKYEDRNIDVIRDLDELLGEIDEDIDEDIDEPPLQDDRSSRRVNDEPGRDTVETPIEGTEEPSDDDAFYSHTDEGTSSMTDKESSMECTVTCKDESTLRCIVKALGVGIIFLFIIHVVRRLRGDGAQPEQQ